MFVFSKLLLMLHHRIFSLIIGVNEDPRENIAFLIPQKDGADFFVTQLCVDGCIL